MDLIEIGKSKDNRNMSITSDFFLHVCLILITIVLIIRHDIVKEKLF